LTLPKEQFLFVLVANAFADVAEKKMIAMTSIRLRSMGLCDGQ